ncbi:MAG: hypothetical protein RMK84_10540 [Oscillochloridaceae bacterium]|nr:hypothetical protein [Chloroflexaceae bacterium]MDW8390550.1 hypothetical protein [Oscillochloridaceae bacterium]
MRSPRAWLLLLLLVILLLLPACGAEPSEEDLVGRGGPTPQAAVESFLATLNEALQADLTDETARRGWAERLASYFAPSERADQRIVFSRMLAAYAQSAVRPVYGSTATVQIAYSGTEVIERQSDRALVRVVDGKVTLQWLDGEGQVVRERTSALATLMGQTEGFPVVRVGGSWFITEG